MYTDAIIYINKGKAKPKDEKELYRTIINPMIEERSQIDGKVIWQYNSQWEKLGFSGKAQNLDYVESFYDDVKGLYYIINHTAPYIKKYMDKGSCISVLGSLFARAVTPLKYDTTKQLVRTIMNPAQPFGFTTDDMTFNLFKQSRYIELINNPEMHTDYKHPTYTLEYFKSLIPDDETRRYLLSFLKTKFTTFKYSPVILFLIGTSGSGKDTFVNLLSHIIGHSYVAKPRPDVFLETQNGWILDNYFIQLDEYGNKVTNYKDKMEVLGNLKTYSGSPEIQIRAMRTDGYNAKHCITFILTSNTNPLPLEADDRRLLIINTPNKLQNQEFVALLGGLSEFQDTLIRELPDFCAYLGKEVSVLNGTDYVVPPMGPEKQAFLATLLPANERISFILTHNKMEELVELFELYNIPDFNNSWDKGQLLDSKLEALYEAMTEGKGSYIFVTKNLKAAGFKRSYTSRTGAGNVAYYYIPALATMSVQFNQLPEDGNDDVNISEV
jgi:energy-coupling factor transporter ATP-binding protein EcfA2